MQAPGPSVSAKAPRSSEVRDRRPVGMIGEPVLDLLMLLGGAVLLYLGADWLVGGAAALARSLGISSLLIGLTVVAYGTSMPELLVSVQSALGGHRDIALGNVLGSNTANLGLILGATTSLRTTRIDGALRRRELPVLMLSACLVPLLLWDGEVTRWEGAGLLALALGYTGWMILGSTAAGRAVSVTAEAADPPDAPSTRPGRVRLAAFTLVGLVVLMLGGQLLVEGAIGTARAIGISERVVGLTIVAVGTSLPELATSLIAAWRGYSEIAVGNLIGSNIFNVLVCLGAASIAGPVGAPLGALTIDLSFMIWLTMLACLMMRTERTMTRVEGGLLFASYAAFVALVITLR